MKANILARALVFAAVAVGMRTAEAEYATIFWTVGSEVEGTFSYSTCGVAYKAPSDMSYGHYLLDGTEIAGGIVGAEVKDMSPLRGEPMTGALEVRNGVDYDGYTFRVELFDDSGDLMAYSKTESFASLRDAIHCVGMGTGQSMESTWSPTVFTAVPEPTSGVLVLLGFAGLALRRRRV